MTNDPQGPSPMEALERSVVDDRRDQPVSIHPGLYGLLFASTFDNGIPVWGANIKLRDRKLREFIDHENLFASALGIVCARNAALSWDVKGDDPRLVEASHYMLNNVNFGGGWEEFMIQTTIDLATQDNGAWIEIVRAEDHPLSPTVGLNHLDSQRVWQTGNPETPAIYQDADGGMHPMKWYQVVQLLEMPAAVTPEWGGFFYKAQYSALTRLLRASRIMESTWIYKDEKLSGRNTRAIHLLQGIGQTAINDALTRSQLANDAEGLRRYSPPVFAASIDPQAEVDVKTIALASLPDGFKEEEAVKLYIMALSMAFLTDYQEFAPLPGGNLGTSAQSEILDKKSRGKGPALFQRLTTRIMNMNGVLPRGVQFAFNLSDPDAEALLATTRKTRAEGRGVRAQSGELTVRGLRQVALDEGDMSVELFDQLAEEEAAVPAPAPAGLFGAPAAPAPVAASAPHPGDVTPETTIEGEERGAAAKQAGVRAQSDTVPFGPLIMSRLHRAYSDTADDVSGLGYFDTTDARIEVASAIGPALAVFEERMRDAGLWDLQVQAADADTIVAAAKTLGGIDPVNITDIGDVPSTSDEETRLAVESDVQTAIHAGLEELRRNVRARLAELATAEVM